MIQPQELRVGNIVLENNGDYIDEFIVAAVNSLTGTAIDKDDNITSMEYLEPIPLTEEWLLKLGIVLHEYKTGVKPIFVTNTLFLVWAGSHLVVSFKDPESKVFIDLGLKRIHYVHQLQNWYAENTGEELKVKEMA